MIILPDCYREIVRRWMVNLLTWEEGPSFLGRETRGDNVCDRCRAAGLELMPVVGPEMIVFALMRGEVFIAGLKLERMAADEEFVEEMTQFALMALEALKYKV